jgi:hypothetical protein
MKTPRLIDPQGKTQLPLPVTGLYDPLRGIL